MNKPSERQSVSVNRRAGETACRRHAPVLRFAGSLTALFRQLMKNPGFTSVAGLTAVAVFTLALGIGVNAAIFTLFDVRWNRQPQDRKEIT